MVIRWVLKLGPRMVSLMKKNVGSLIRNTVTKNQEAEMVGSGCGP